MPTEGLRELIESLKRERRHWDRTRIETSYDKRIISHRYANALQNDLEEECLFITPLKDGTANYFKAELEGVRILISPFASQVEWWMRPSVGFMEHVASRDHSWRWAIILFRVPGEDGFWIEGADFARVFKLPEELPEKFTASNVRVAVRKKVAREFSGKEELIHLLRHGLESGPKLIKRRGVAL